MPVVLAALVYAAALCGLYARALDAPYWHDDVIWMYWGRNLGTLGDLFVPHHFTSFVRPVTMAWFVLTAPATAMHPWAARLASVALVTASATLLHVLVLRLSRRTSAAVASGLLFVTAAHHWELICGAAAVGDILVGLCAIAAVLLHLDGEGRPGRAGAAAGMATLAMLSKESGLVVPLLITLEDLLLCRTAGSRLRRLSPVWGSSALTLALELVWVGRGRGVPALPTLSTFTHDGPRMVASTFLACPAPHSVLLGLLALLLLCGLLAVSWRRWPALGLFLGWVMIAWLPYLLLAPAQLDQDRYSYLSSFGAAGALGLVLGAMLSRSRTFAITAVLALCALIGWNVGWQQQYTASLLDWLRPRAALREQVEDVARHLPSDTTVYVYAHPETWHEPGYALALYADLPAARVRDWYEALDGPPGVMIHWDEDQHGYHDLTRRCAAHDAALTATGWDFSTSAGRAGWSGMSGLDASSLPRFETDGHGVLAGPPVRIDPWALWCVDVQYEAEAVAPNASLRVAWTSEGDASADWRHTASAALRPGGGVARVYLSARAAWWTEGAITRLYLQPSDQPARLRVLGVRLCPVPPRESRRGF